MGFDIFSKKSNNKKNNNFSSKMNSSFSSGEDYSLAVVVTLLKHKALLKWGLDEAIEILTSIDSLRQCILEQNSFVKNTASMSPAEVNKENSDTVFKLGRRILAFDNLCEKHGLNSPLKGLNYQEVIIELYKLVKLDKDFYASSEAFTITEEEYEVNKNSKDSNFFSTETQHKYANIKIYDTLILLMVKASTETEFKQSIESRMDTLRKSAQRRKELLSLRQESLDALKNGKDVSKNAENILKSNKEIEELGRILGNIENDLNTLAVNSDNMPNAFNTSIPVNDLWEKYISNLFDVIGDSIKRNSRSTYTQNNASSEIISKTEEKTESKAENQK